MDEWIHIDDEWPEEGPQIIFYDKANVLGWFKQEKFYSIFGIEHKDVKNWIYAPHKPK